MARTFGLLTLVVAGLVLALVVDPGAFDAAAWYGELTTGLLAVGLYVSTHGIVIEQARAHLTLIVLAVTVGVFAKAVLIGGTLAVGFGDPMFWIWGIAVAQIDPLSVAALLRGSRMSDRAKTILAAWASFDDPMTVLLTLYVPALIVAPQTNATAIASGGLTDYLVGVGANLGFALLVGGVWWAFRRRFVSSVLVFVAGYALLALSFAVAIAYVLMLGLALVGLVLRPERFDRVGDWAVRVALAAAALLVGIMLGDGLDLVRGVALGCAAFVAQLVVGGLLARRLPRPDRLHLAFAQQNGITAIILSLLLEPAYPGTVAVVAPAIIVVNSIHAASNRLLERRLSPSPG